MKKTYYLIILLAGSFAKFMRCHFPGNNKNERWTKLKGRLALQQEK